jgi:hypothetical protein
MDFSRFFAALYVSEGWYEYWRWTKKPYGKARCIVLYDRVMSGQIDAEAHMLSK